MFVHTDRSYVLSIHFACKCMFVMILGQKSIFMSVLPAVSSAQTGILLRTMNTEIGHFPEHVDKHAIACKMDFQSIRSVCVWNSRRLTKYKAWTHTKFRHIRYYEYYYYFLRKLTGSISEPIQRIFGDSKNTLTAIHVSANFPSSFHSWFVRANGESRLPRQNRCIKSMANTHSGPAAWSLLRWAPA